MRPDEGVFLWVLRNFLEHLFYRTRPGDCFCISFYLRKQPLTAVNAAVRRCSSSLNFIEKRLQHRCFPVTTAKYFRTAFFIEHFWWLLFQLLRKTVLRSLRKNCERIQFRIGASNVSKNELFHSQTSNILPSIYLTYCWSLRFKEQLFIKAPFNLMAASVLISMSFYLNSHVFYQTWIIIYFVFQLFTESFVSKSINYMNVLIYAIVIGNRKIAWRVVWIEYYLRLKLSSRRY